LNLNLAETAGAWANRAMALWTACLRSPATVAAFREALPARGPRPAMRIVSYREVAEHVYEVVMETAERGQVTRRVLVLPESLMGDEEAPKEDGQGDDQGPRYGWTLSGFKAREAAKKFSEGMGSDC
jgi:hypothetical protein